MTLKLTKRSKWILIIAFMASVFTLSILFDRKQTMCDFVSESLEKKEPKNDDYPTLKLCNVTAENLYISANYTSRSRPTYYRDKGIQDVKWNLGAYYVIGELARRFQADFIIDVGCGTAHKLAKFQDEFKLIGIDYGSNLMMAKEEHPRIRMIGMDLDHESCRLDLDEEIVRNAVVISADVVEHLRNPLTCYIKLIKILADRAMALVLTSPDRNQMASVFRGAFTRNLQGPPINTAHVREWTLAEMQTMLIDQGLTPMYSGQVCGRLGSCSKGFSPADSSLTNQVHIMANIQLRGRLGSEVLTQVFAFIVVTSRSSQTHLDFNVQYLVSQGIQVVLLLIGTKNRHSQKGVHFRSFEDASAFITETNRGNCIKDGDWLIVMDANDVISFPQSPFMMTSLRNNLLRIGQLGEFNAVAVTTLFMHSEQGLANPSSKPIKILSNGPWNRTPTDRNDDLKLASTQTSFIKIWRKDSSCDVQLRFAQTSIGDWSIERVMRKGKWQIFPFHAQCLRFHPANKEIFPRLDYELLRLYLLEITLGYTASDRKKATVNKYLY